MEYFNTVRELKHNGVLQKNPFSHKTTNNKRVLSLGPPEDNIDHDIEAIIMDNCSWAEIESHWAATKNHRMNEIFTLKSTHDIISKWPQYKNPLGFKLIDIDFKHLYPKAESLHVNFQNFGSKIDYVFEDRVKDPSIIVLFQTMSKKESLSENGRCVGIFQLLHSILVPSTKVFKVDNGKKLCNCFSIRDSQRSFIIDGNSVVDCEQELLKKV